MIFRDRRFAPLFWTQFLGAFNDNFFKNALVILITYRSITMAGLDSLKLVPLLGGVFIFPYFLFSATAGQLADKFQKARLIGLTKIAELVIMALAATGFALDNFELLVAALFLMGLQSSFFGPLKYGIIPSLLSPRELVGGNAWVTGGTFSAILLGTIGGGLAAQGQSPTLSMGLPLVLLAAAGWAVSALIRPVAVHPQNFSIDPTFVRSTAAVLRLTWQRKDMFQTLMGISWFWFLGAAILSLLPLWAKNLLGAGEGVSTLFLSTFVVGMGLGSILVKILCPAGAKLGLTPLALLGLGLALLNIACLLPQAAPPGQELQTISTFWQSGLGLPLLISLLLLAVCGGVYIVVQMAHIQESCRPEEVSRMIAGNNIWNALFMVCSALVMAWLNQSLGVAKASLALVGLNTLALLGICVLHGKKTLALFKRGGNG